MRRAMMMADYIADRHPMVMVAIFFLPMFLAGMLEAM